MKNRRGSDLIIGITPTKKKKKKKKTQKTKKIQEQNERLNSPGNEQ